VAAVAALALTVASGQQARAQAAKPAAADQNTSLKRMEIWNGPTRTVHFFSEGYSPGEESALRDLARAENDLAVADDIQTLRRLYLRNERILEQRRGQVNPLLYGYSSEYAAASIAAASGATAASATAATPTAIPTTPVASGASATSPPTSAIPGAAPTSPTASRRASATKA
jgi:hypothetical protein